MIVWIGKRLALAVHDRQIAEHGGDGGIRDEALLESALARAQQVDAYGDPPPDLALLAATLAHALVRNHPFVDGNKRTAHVCYRVFLTLNDAELVASEDAKYIAMLRLAEGTWSVDDFADWMRGHLVLATTLRVTEPAAAYDVR